MSEWKGQGYVADLTTMDVNGEMVEVVEHASLKEVSPQCVGAE